MRSMLILAVSLMVFETFALTGARAETPPADDGPYTLSGPYTHDNLAVYLVHAPDALKGKAYLPLKQAMEKGIVVVKETGSVNELTIENTSPDTDVYIQSGDIVKGGRQDRTFADDMILPPKSGEKPIAAFCVEHGRWSQRGAEPSTQFTGGSGYALSDKKMKIAAKQEMSQSAVWSGAAAAQTKLSTVSGGSVQSPASPSSYQLSLENKDVADKTEAYVKEISPAAAEKSDVIGMAFAINGKINSADIYASHDLFMQMWPKLLQSAAVESLGEVQKDKKFDAPAKEAVAASLAATDFTRATADAKSSEKVVTDRTVVVSKETPDALFYETRDKARDGEWVHRNCLTKDPSHPVEQPQQQMQQQQQQQSQPQPQQQMNPPHQPANPGPIPPRFNPLPRPRQIPND